MTIKQFVVKDITVPRDVRQFIRVLREQTGARSAVLADAEMHVFHGAVCRVLLRKKDDAPLAADITYFGKRAKAPWAPYENWYIGYVPPAHRRNGYGTLLRGYVDDLARAAGCVRVHSIAGSLSGLALHEVMGYAPWGLTAQLDVPCDTALVPAADIKQVPLWAQNKFPERVLRKPTTYAAIRRALGKQRMRYEETT